MSGKIPVKSLFEYLQMMLREKWGYIFGTAGVKCTKAIIQKAVENPNNPNPELTEKYGPEWLGHMVADCSGIMVHIWGLFGLKIPHGSSSIVRQGYIVDCGSVPHPGWAALVDPTPDTPDNNHIGIVSEDCKYVYECKGTRYGFVKSELSKTKFNKFGRFKDVDYSEAPEGDEPLNTPYYAEITTHSSSLNIRSEPSTSDTIIGKAEKGSKVKVVYHGAEWDYIEKLTGLRGYVSNKYLTPLEEVSDHDDRDGDGDKDEDKGEKTIAVPKDKIHAWLFVLKDLETEIESYIKGGKS